MASQSFSGRRVLLAVAALVTCTAVIPPAAATALARWRIARANETVSAVASRLNNYERGLRALARSTDVLCGQGSVPRATDEAGGWLSSPMPATADLAREWPADPWGSCYLLNLRALTNSGRGLLISAGPDGRIDTPFDAPSPKGDDIAATVR